MELECPDEVIHRRSVPIQGKAARKSWRPPLAGAAGAADIGMRVRLGAARAGGGNHGQTGVTASAKIAPRFAFHSAARTQSRHQPVLRIQ